VFKLIACKWFRLCHTNYISREILKIIYLIGSNMSCHCIYTFMKRTCQQENICLNDASGTSFINVYNKLTYDQFNHVIHQRPRACSTTRFVDWLACRISVYIRLRQYELWLFLWIDDVYYVIYLYNIILVLIVRTQV